MKNWKPGVADEAWKVMICARDASRAHDLITGLISILVDASDEANGIEQLKLMSGKEIMDGLIAYQASATLSVANGLKS